MPNTSKITDRLEAFRSWFTSNGGYTHPKTELAFDNARGVHMRVKAQTHNALDPEGVTDPLPKGTVIISCPHSLSLSALNVKGYPPVFPQRQGRLHVPQDLLAKTRPQCVAALLLIAQTKNADDSFWKHYLRVLPAAPSASGSADTPWELDSPLWWDESESRWLQGTNLAKGTQDLRAVWEREWKQLQPLVQESNTTQHDFTWAMCILGSRAFSSSQVACVPCPTSAASILASYNPDMLLYPGIDSLNHNPLSRNRWFADTERFGIICEDEPGPGDECWNPYGGKGNGELLLSYGFCIPNNPCDTFALKLAHPPPALLLPCPSTPSSTAPATTAGELPAQSAEGPAPMTPHNKPPALSLQHNTYFIRRASRSALLPPDADYPAPAAPVPVSHVEDGQRPLAGFPHLLLSTLSHALANTRERSAMGAMLRTTVSDPVRLWRAMGERNSWAVKGLLYARLCMELQRVEQPLRTVDTALEESNEDDAAADPCQTRRQRRLQAAKIYLEGQKAILEENIGAVESDVLSAILGETIVAYGPLFTIPEAHTWLAALSAHHGEALEQGLEKLYGDSVCDVLDVAPDEEENMWAMVLVVLAHALVDEVDVDEVADGEVAVLRRQLRRWVEGLDAGGYGILAAAEGEADTHSSGDDDEDEKELEEQIIASAAAVYEALLEESKQSSDASREYDEKIISMFAPQRWTAGLVRACVRAVREESLRFTLRTRAWREAKMAGLVAIRGNGGIHGGIAGQEQVTESGKGNVRTMGVVCMYFGERCELDR